MKRYLGLALIPQAGVAIGLAFLAKRILPDETGDVLLAIILASSVLYELIGPWCAKKAIFLSGSLLSQEPAIAAPEESEGEEKAEPVAHKGAQHGTVL